jgi:predicted nucleic acid-binding protein
MTARRGPSLPIVPVFVDTGAYYAFADARDRNHARADELFGILGRRRFPLHTTHLIVAETHVLLKSRVAYYATRQHARSVARRAVEAIYRSSVAIDPVTPADERAALALLAQYADQDVSFTDATSFALMHRLGLTHAFCFDEDFTIAGFTDIRHALLA